MQDVFDIIGVFIRVQDNLSSLNQARLNTCFLQYKYYFASIFYILWFEVDRGRDSEQGGSCLSLLILFLDALLFRRHQHLLKYYLIIKR